MKFKVTNGGDYSVGISGFEFDIKFEFEGGDDYSTFFDEEFKDRFKKFMIDELSCHNGVTNIYTQKELDDLIHDYIMSEELLNGGEYDDN